MGVFDLDVAVMVDGRRQASDWGIVSRRVRRNKTPCALCVNVKRKLRPGDSSSLGGKQTNTAWFSRAILVATAQTDSGESGNARPGLNFK